MCIAIVSERGVELPNDDILRVCFRNNSDGAGFSFNNDNNKVEIVKGFMDFNSFINALHAYDKKYCLKDRGVLIHMRIGTSGKKSALGGGFRDPSCTHPFPISTRDKHLKKLRFVSDYAVIHNGVINFCDDSKSEISDTMIFIKEYVSCISSNRGWFYNKKNIDLIYKLAGSKLAFLNGRGDCQRTEGFHQKDGIWYSNYSYEETSLYSYYGYSYWDDWYRDYFIDEVEIPLQRLSPSQSVYMDGDIISYDTRRSIYVSEDGDVYELARKETYDKKIKMSDLSYIGCGYIVDGLFSLYAENEEDFVPFRQDAVAVV